MRSRGVSHARSNLLRSAAHPHGNLTLQKLHLSTRKVFADNRDHLNAFAGYRTILLIGWCRAFCRKLNAEPRRLAVSRWRSTLSFSSRAAQLIVSKDASSLSRAANHVADERLVTRLAELRPFERLAEAVTYATGLSATEFDQASGVQERFVRGIE
jgi:hypothetical protein